jgi:2'-5' RNA ligase
MTESLFFVGVVPPKDLQRDVTAIKRIAAHRFHSKHALNSPPHVTLVPPFWFEDGELPSLKESLAAFAGNVPDFEVDLKGFGAFKPRVIYIQVYLSDALHDCYRELREMMQETWNIKSDRRTRFHPHMTIAFKDLSRSAFYRAWDYFSKQAFKANFPAGGLVLLKHHDRAWHIESTFPFVSERQAGLGR